MLKIFFTTKCSDSNTFFSSVMEKHFNLSVNKKDFVYNEFGKPRLKSGELHFNISNTGDACAVAVSDTEVGIDLERCGRMFPSNVARKYFYDDIKALCSPLEIDILLKVWTIKEAFVKYLGKSILSEIKHIYYDGWSIFYRKQKTDVELHCMQQHGYFITVVSDCPEYEFIEY